MSAAGFSHEGTTPRSKRLTTHGQYGASLWDVHAFVRKGLDWLGRWGGSGETADFSKQFQRAQLALELLSLGHHDEHSCLSPLAK